MLNLASLHLKQLYYWYTIHSYIIDYNSSAIKQWKDHKKIENTLCDSLWHWQIMALTDKLEE